MRCWCESACFHPSGGKFRLYLEACLFFFFFVEMMASFFNENRGFSDVAASVECHFFFRVCPGCSTMLLFWCLSCRDDSFGFQNTQCVCSNSLFSRFSALVTLPSPSLVTWCLSVCYGMAWPAFTPCHTLSSAQSAWGTVFLKLELIINIKSLKKIWILLHSVITVCRYCSEM